MYRHAPDIVLMHMCKGFFLSLFNKCNQELANPRRPAVGEKGSHNNTNISSDGNAVCSI